ncbi:hypothetical protein MSAN_02129000 [Mycena sanguinolenta]|uniref:Uncharacterized protein n=1 Tax=Mycena sanguinolenta TaxID=230812 RepID=A0A8H6XFN1_9AGAR|nr:hypothetical protein MSAN_02129000 [Mycena sanguinolenta]
MHFSSFNKVVLLSTAFSLQARALPQITKGDFEIMQVNTAANHALAIADDTPTTGPFIPTADNLIVNTTVPQGVNAALGWIDPTVAGVAPFSPVFDGSAYNISVFYTPPSGVETFVFGVDTGPDTTDFCGIISGYWIEGVIDSSVLGTYLGRWIVEYGQSTQPDAPVDPNSGCGPDPFNMTTVEFTRTWEVVAA